MKSKQKIKTQWRQGDVLIERVEILPGKITPQPENGRIILAHGEVTGHAHELVEVQHSQIFDADESFKIGGDLDDVRALPRMALTVGRKTAVKHQEHQRIPLKKGSYRVTRQREYSPQELRNVAD